MIFRHIALFFAALVGLHGQSVTPVPADVSVEFRLYAWQVDIPSLRYGRTQVVEEIEAGSRSLVHKYEGSPNLAFTLAKTKVVNNQPTPAAATATIPAGVKKITLLTVAGGSDKYRMYAFPEDASSLPPRHARLHNLTNATLRVDYNKTERIELAAGKSALLAATGRGIVAVVSRMHDGRWRPLFSGVVMPEPAGGPNVLLALGRGNSGLNMFTIPAWPAEPAPVSNASERPQS